MFPNSKELLTVDQLFLKSSVSKISFKKKETTKITRIKETTDMQAA